MKIKTALLSVFDKTEILDFARKLRSFGIEILSTGGTARALRDAGIEIVEVAEYTGFPEMMGGASRPSTRRSTAASWPFARTKITGRRSRSTGSDSSTSWR